MNYKTIYDQICARGQTDRQLDYSENHHIIPKCMGGSNDESNLTRLTYREHYMVHHLLIKMHPAHSGLNYGFLCMLRKHNEGRILTARMYQTIKENFSQYKKLFCTLENPGKCANSRAVARERMLNNNPNQGGATNHTARPVEVVWHDGTVERFEYMQLITETKGVPYSSLKVAKRKGLPMKKYNITSIRNV